MLGNFLIKCFSSSEVFYMLVLEIKNISQTVASLITASNQYILYIQCSEAYHFPHFVCY